MHSIDALYSWTIRDIKDALQHKAKMPREQQRLLLGQIDLVDTLRLSEVAAPQSKPNNMLMLTLVLVLEEYCDYERVARAVRKDWNVLQYATTELRHDRTIMRSAIRKNWKAMNLGPASFWADRGLVLLLLKQDGMLLEKASEELRADVVLVAAAMEHNWRAMRHASPELFAEPYLLLDGIARHAGAMEYAADKLKKNYNFLMAAVKVSGVALQYVPADAKGDFDLVHAAVRQDGRALAHAGPQLRARHKELLGAAGGGTEGHKRAARWVDSKVRGDEDEAAFYAGWSF